MEKEEVKRCLDLAIKAVERCCTPHGLFASPAPDGYTAIWSRDSNITFLGASLIDKPLFKKTFRQSLIELAQNQSEKGQVPNAIDKWAERIPHVDFQTLDSSLWFVIGHYVYKKRYNDSSLFNKHKKNINKALTWLSYQDVGEDGLPEQLPTTDWQDAFPHRYGHTINTQALYYHALNLTNQKKQAQRVKKATNEIEHLQLWDNNLGFYLPWRWKNHNAYHEKGEWFDSLGNLLAIIFDLASNEQAKMILDHIKKNKIAEPYPIKTISPPIYKGTKDWQDYFLDCEAGTPYHYSNGGIWTYIGGFYILALIKQKRFKEAEYQFQKLTEANLKKPIFNEWLHGQTGIPGHPASSSNSEEGDQAWNAGMYILAHESLNKKKILI